MPRSIDARLENAFSRFTSSTDATPGVVDTKEAKSLIQTAKTIDKENGIIPLTAIKKGYYRIPLPIHSYLAYGNIKMLKNIKFKSSWGKLSILEFLSKKKRKNL